MTHVFVSYSHADEDAALETIAWLNAAGIATWHDQQIHAGAPWREEIASAIEQAAHFLFLGSRHSVASDHCIRELNYALELDQPVITLFLEAVELSGGLRMSLLDRQVIYGAEVGTDAARDRLLTALTSDTGPAPLARAALRSNRRTWLPAAAAILIAAVLVGLLVRQASSPEATDQPPGALEHGSIALMPLTSVDPSAEAPALGIHSDLLSRLGLVPGLVVIAPVSVQRAAGRTRSAIEAGQLLNVRHVVQGTVQSAGSQLRINVSLTDMQQGRVTWTHSMDVGADELFARQAELADLVARQLQLEVAAPTRSELLRPRSNNVEALLKYREADRLAQSTDTARKRIELLTAAVALDPLFAEALSELGRLRARINLWGEETTALARRAVELQPGRADFVANLAATLTVPDMAEARRLFERAQQMNPLLASDEYADALFHVESDLTGALEQYERLRQVDPLNPRDEHVQALVADGQLEAARDLLAEIQRYAPNRDLGGLGAQIADAENRVGDAIVLRARSSLRLPDPFVLALHRIGETDAARKLSADLGIDELVLNDFGLHHDAHIAIERDSGLALDLAAAATHSIRVPHPRLQALAALQARHDGLDPTALQAAAIAGVRAVLPPPKVLKLPGFYVRYDAPLEIFLMMRLAGDDSGLDLAIRRVRWTLANGGHFNLPRREHLLLAVAAALEGDRETAVEEFDAARRTGLRNLAMLAFFGLVDDPWNIYHGLTADPRYRDILDQIRRSNAADRALVRVELPELFPGES